MNKEHIGTNFDDFLREENIAIAQEDILDNIQKITEEINQERKMVTNEEWLKSLSTEELAEELHEMTESPCRYFAQSYPCRRTDEIGACQDCIITYLKQEHTNDKQ